MDGVYAVREVIVRQVQIINVGNFNRPNMASPLIQQQQQLPAAPQRNPRCLNFITFVVLYFIGIGSIVLGAVHLNDCPAETMLPKGLVILGGIMIVRRLLNCVPDCRGICEEERGEDPNGCFQCLNFLLYLAEFGMLIAVSYYAFSIHPSTDPVFYNMKDYCNYGLYKTAFIGCIIIWVFYGLTILCGCCVLCVLSK